MEGNDLEDVLVNVEFLEAASLHQEIRLGKRVVVLGGGNVACDCAGVACRLGAEEVHIACLESRETMPAAKDELAEVEKDGVIVHPAQTFNKILSEKGKVSGVEFSNVKSFTFDENRRAIIEKEENSEHVINCDTVIFATGQSPALDGSFGVELGRGNRIVVDENYMTSSEGVFAAGDVVTGTASVIGAIAETRKLSVLWINILAATAILKRNLLRIRTQIRGLERLKTLLTLSARKTISLTMTSVVRDSP